MKSISRAAGFTLIELIAVIIILGVVGTAVISFIGFSAQLFVDVNERDKVLADSRFVVERLNRELRDAIPNSVRVAGNGSIHCLEFMPIEWSTFYTDIPAFPDGAASTIQAVELQSSLDDYTSNTSHFVLVYPVSTQDVYGNNNKRVPLANITGSGVLTVNLGASIEFAAESPASRLYIGGQPVSYCVSNGRITRHSGYQLTANQQSILPPNTGVLMGTNLQNVLSSNPTSTFLTNTNTDDPFRVFESTLTRNAFVHIVLRFARQDQPNEVVVFNNEVHVANVP
ncbi:type II secretion system protein [Alteromonadaceae bacterium M269]|nr:type II secretion system protein [Alteromonadaceae bacterium M269]